MQSSAWYLKPSGQVPAPAAYGNGTGHGDEDRKTSTSHIQKFISATEAIPPHTHTVLTNKHNE